MSGKEPAEVPIPASDPNDSPAEDEGDLAAILQQAMGGAAAGDSVGGVGSADLLAAAATGLGAAAVDVDKDASSNSKEASSVEGDLAGLGAVGGPSDSVSAMDVEAAL